MMKTPLTIDELIKTTRRFCEIEGRENHLLGLQTEKPSEHMLNINFSSFSVHSISLN